MAERRGVKRESIVIDPGIGFGKSQEQNIELIAKLDQLVEAFPDFPLLIGTSRKSFIGRILADENGEPAPVDERLHGTMASITAAVLQGAHIVRVHDVKADVRNHAALPMRSPLQQVDLLNPSYNVTQHRLPKRTF